MRIGFILVLILLLPLLSQAQKPQDGSQGSAPNSGLSILFGSGDSLSTQYFTIENPNVLSDMDLLLEMPANAQYDPVKLETIDFVNIGNMGSSAFPLHYTWNSDINFDLGYHQFDVYKKTLANTSLVRSNIPVTNLGFSPLSGRENFIVDALFSNSYKEKLLLNVDYRRINQNGYFQNQITKDTNAGFHLYWTPRQSYSALFSMFVNNNSEGQNGGITTDTLFGQEFYENLTNIPVFSADASSRYESRSYVLNHTYSTKTDSSLIHFDISHQMEYENGYYRYFDNTIDDMEYDQYPNFITDDRGIRHIVRFKNFKNSFDIQTKLKDNILLRAGLSQKYFSTDDELLEFSTNEISAYGRLQLKLYERINLISNLQLGLINNNGNVSLESKAILDIPGSNTLEGGFNFSRYSSSYVHRNLNITQSQIWMDEFGKQVESEIWASIHLGKLNTKITASQMLLDNIIYLTADQIYFQNPDIISFSKLIVENEMHYKVFHLENTFLFQSFSDNILNLPNVWAKNIFYLNFPLFNNVVDTNLGVESRMTPSRNARFYHPILGDIYATSEDYDFYPDLSLFGVFDVDDFRVFIRAENFSQIFTNDLQYHFLSYPQNELKIRFGFRWLLSN